MVFEKIEALKKQWTDKYVVVDASRPELRRFDGQTGKVKTVNMSGRALVEFDAYANIGWYDIDLSFLKQVDAPLPKVKEEKHKPEAKATPSTVKPTEKGATKPAPAAGGGGKSAADILAAARGSKPTPAVQTNEPPKVAGEKPKLSTADILAAARSKPGAVPASAPSEPAPPPAVAKLDPKKMSPADILAAARGKKAPEAAASAAPAPAAKPAKAAPPPAPEPEPEPEPAPAVEAPAGGVGSKKGAFKTVDEILAYCRKVDTK